MKFRNLLLAFLLLAGSAWAQIPAGLGWYEVPNSTLRPVCDTGANPNCRTEINAGSSRNIMAAWNSGVFDQANNRLLVWGGGHADYPGNEVYGFDFDNLAWTRLTNSSTTFTGCGGGNDIYPDGKIRTIHTYGGQTFIQTSGKLFQSYTGANYSCADQSAFFQHFFVWDPTNGWVRLNFTMASGQSAPSLSEGPEEARAAWDAATGLVFIKTNGFIYSYNLSTNVLTRLASNQQNGDIRNTMVIDPKRKRVMLIGFNADISSNQIAYWDISTGSAYQRQTLTVTGVTNVQSTVAPGAVYDPGSDQILAWIGGQTVYTLPLTTLVWSSSAPALLSGSAAPAAAQGNGTWNRFNYSPTSKVFVLANSVDGNVFTLRTKAAADQDFGERCNAAGVVLCQGFDDSTGFVHDVNVYPATVSGVYPVQDASTKKSGASSLRIDVTAPASANSGKFDTAFSGTNFGAGKDFYFQVSVRITQNMIDNVINSGTTGWTSWKSYSFFNGNTSCTGLSYVNGFSGQTALPIIAGTCNCSAGGFYTPFTTCVSPAPPYNYQQGPPYTCPHGYTSGSSCFFWSSVVGHWATFYHHLRFGAYNSGTDRFAGSVIEAWVSIDSGPMQQWNNIPSFDIESDGNTSMNHLELYPYMTGKNASNTNYATSSMWFDELIISTLPIAAPMALGAPGAPSPPTNLTVIGH